MAPKTRLTLSIVALTGVVAILISLSSMYALADARFQEVSEVARLSADTVKVYVLQRIQQEASPPPNPTMDEAKTAWRDALRDDLLLESFLISTIAASPSLVEISITDETEKVLAGSNPSRLGGPVPLLAGLETWNRQGAGDKLWQLLSAARDLELKVPLGAGEATEPVFVIHIIVSTALVRDAVVPQVRNLAILSGLALVLAALLAGVLSNLAARPLERVSKIIDLIAEGKDELPPSPPDRELAALQSKLALLGEKARDAGAPASLRGGVDQMLERLEEAILLFDSERKLVIASKAAERFLGAGRWEMIGRPLDEIFPVDDPVGALVQTSAKMRRPIRNHSVTWPEPGKGELRVLVTVEVLEDFPDRRYLGGVVTLRDAESRRQLESQIDSSYRREALGRLLQGVAHEIKNPLNSIYTHLQLLQMELGDRAPEAKQTLEVIGREIKTLDRMVVTLLDFTRPLELTFAETNLSDLATEIAGLVRPRAEEKGIALEAKGETSGAEIQADRALLRQAVLNVVTNAVECMSEPGVVRIEVSRTPEECCLSVTDEGPGIPEELRDKIFQLYFTTKGKRGSGIGLAMAYRITQLHNGTLDFESVPGRGTTFRFSFPAG